MDSTQSDYGTCSDSDVESDIVVPVKGKNHDSNISVIFAVAAMVAILFVVVITNQSTESSSIYSNTPVVADSSDGPSVWTLNREGYDPLPYFLSDASDTLQYAIFESYDAVIEPHSNMNLYVEDFNTTSQNIYLFTVCSDETGYCKSGNMSNYNSSTVYASVTFGCQPYDEYTITLTKYSSEGVVAGVSDGKAICVYVRREIRTLSTEDLDATMDAMYTLWSTTEEAGQELYGYNFHNSTYFVSAHHFSAAWRDGDHIHEGLGFVTQHVKMTNAFEMAMQAVDPSVSLPYWDFTIDSSQNTYIFSSFVFRSAIFGSINKPADKEWGWTYRNDSLQDAAIKNGRWKNLKADLNYQYADLDSNFGYMRAPWNGNPNPYVSRYSAYTTKLPDCVDHYQLLEYSTLADFLINAPYAAHASAHGAIGSVYGCDLMDPLREKGLILDEDAQNSLCQKWSFNLKELFRKNYISARSNCSYTSLDYQGIDCTFECNTDKYDTMTLQLKSVISSSYVGSLTDKQWEEWRDFVCTGDGAKVFAGDHVESASPADPSFWPMHPTLERLLQAKFMSGSFVSTDWASDPINDYVCDKAQCYENDVLDYHTECCFGHYEHDQLMDFVTANKSNGVLATNRQVVLDVDPTGDSYALNYVYDNFEWDHCDENFISLLTALSQNQHSSQLWGR